MPLPMTPEAPAAQKEVVKANAKEDGRSSFLAALGALCSYVVLLVIVLNHPVINALTSLFGMVTVVVLLPFPLLSLNGCMAAFVYGFGGWSTKPGKLGIAFSIITVLLYVLLFKQENI